MTSVKKEREVVINSCYGGFNLSRKAFLRLRELEYLPALKEPDFGEYWPDGSGPNTMSDFFLSGYGSEIKRDDLVLIQVIKELKDEANGRCAKLKIVKIPADVEWEIGEYDGSEWVSEKHREWH